MKKIYSSNSSSSQRDRILEWFSRNPGLGLTTREARQYLDIMMPAARIFELRKCGYNIVTHNSEEQTASGDTRIIAKYFLMGGKDAS